MADGGWQIGRWKNADDKMQVIKCGWQNVDGKMWMIKCKNDKMR